MHAAQRTSTQGSMRRRRRWRRRGRRRGNRDGKRKGAAEEDVSHATTPAGAEDEAASAMWHAEQVAAKEGDEVKENEDGETQPRDFTSEGPHTASEGGEHERRRG